MRLKKDNCIVPIYSIILIRPVYAATVFSLQVLMSAV